LTAHKKTSAILHEIALALPDDKIIKISDLLNILDGRAFGILIFILAVPNCIPNIPGISTIFGFLLLAPSLPMVFGARHLWLPKKIQNYEFQSSQIRSGILKSLPTLQKIEILVRPRFEFLTRGFFLSILGLEVAILAVVLMLPIPLGNMLPGFAIALIALGILQSDGLLIIFANILMALSMRVAYFGLGAGIDGINWLTSKIHILIAPLL
jgi:hypothetical protein